jgi:hypothetical protein
MLPSSGDKQVVYHHHLLYAASTRTHAHNNLKVYTGPDQKLGTQQTVQERGRGVTLTEKYLLLDVTLKF